MSERLPVQVNPFRMAAQGRSFEGVVDLAKAGRLAQALAAPAGEAVVQLAFRVDELKAPVVEGRVRARLTLVCQRCLEPMELEVDVPIQAVLVKSDAEAERLQAQYEPIVIEDETLWVLDLVEDELLLALPLVPAHSTVEECAPHAARALERAGGEVPDEESPADESSGPFAELRKLKPN